MSSTARAEASGRGRPITALSTQLRRLSYVAVDKRDLRLDFLRGLAITAMIVDHTGGDTVLSALTGGNRWIVSAAEFFVYLSGFVIGAVYSTKALRSGYVEAARSLLMRAQVLYRASVGMALGFAALYLFTPLRLWRDRSEGLGMDNPLQAVIGILTLHHAYHGSDVLVMYTLMLVFAPVLIWLLTRGHTRKVLAASFGIWAVAQQFPNEAAIPWPVTNSAFPLASWQLLFVGGMAAGCHRRTITAWLSAWSTPFRLLFAAAIAGILVLNWSYQNYQSVNLPSALFRDATYGSLFDKVSLGPGRVLAFYCMAVIGFTAVDVLWVALYRVFGWYVLTMGQHSLYVYVSHLFVVVAIYNLVWLFPWPTMESANLAAQLSALAVCWVLVKLEIAHTLLPHPHHSSSSKAQRA